ncbi:prolipoprotein diacylglyceryl transferase [Halonatronum saccharophilum]|uniref:prolipoprotein diacylglyceryl transferase n=1 Tax=Halonatronum saccharophilum TaxID=150060 RepID=UPI00047F82DD|nr:prolipoprotein diacylglyceryl transferase [Halonatronum saccharophilum]
MATEVFEVGPFSIHLFGIFIGLGVLAGFYILNLEAKRKRFDKDGVFNFALYVILAAMVGARIYYVLVFNSVFYLSNPMEIFMIHQGGLSIQGGLLGGIIFAFIYLRRKELSFWGMADAFAPAIILGQAIGRVGCDVFGVPVERGIFWGVEIGNQLLHPVQIYEAILNYMLFIFIWNYRDKTKYKGELFLYYLIGFSINRGVVEFFRVNLIFMGIFTVAHITSLVIIFLAVSVLIYIRKKGQSIEEREIDAIKKEEKLRDTLIVLGMIILSIFIYYGIY